MLKFIDGIVNCTVDQGQIFLMSMLKLVGVRGWSDVQYHSLPLQILLIIIKTFEEQILSCK